MVVGVAVNLLTVYQTAYANGWDGYYYVMQTHAWLAYGALQSPDTSLVYPYFILISYLLEDYVMAYKIGASILGGVLVGTTFLLAHEINSKRLIAVLIPSFLIFSPTMTYLVVQFPKNVLGLIFFVLMLRALYQRRFAVAAIMVLLSLLTHRMTGGLCLIISFSYVLQWLNWRWIVGGVVVVITVSLLPGILHISDLMRFEGQLSAAIQFAPLSVHTLFENSINLWWDIELVILSIALVFVTTSYFVDRDYSSADWLDKWAWPLLIFISIFPFFTVEYGSMGYRFFMIAPVVIVSYAVRKFKWPKPVVYLITAVLLGSSAFSYKSYNPKVHDPPNRQYELIVDRLSANYSSAKFPLVIVHKSLAEIVIYKTEFDALNWAPPANISTSEVLRVVSNLDYIHFAKYLSEEELDEVRKLTLHYFAMSETVWNSFYEQVLEHNDEAILKRLERGGNPLEQRPYYLRKGKEKL